LRGNNIFAKINHALVISDRERTRAAIFIRHRGMARACPLRSTARDVVVHEAGIVIADPTILLARPFDKQSCLIGRKHSLALE
jgi:hypothetical protein